MLLKQFFDQESSTYTYLMATESREALIIDPVLEHLDDYLKALNSLDLKLVYCLDTHMHADHVTATGPLRKATACALAMGEQTKAEPIDLRLKDGDHLKINDLDLKAIYTPGHTDDSYCFKIGHRLFTGDTLLINATGRTDFQNGDPYKQYDSLFNKILTLPPETLVFPAHDYNGRTSSTIGNELNNNPRLQVKNAQEYAEIMQGLNLPEPKKIKTAIPKNLKCGLI